MGGKTNFNNITREISNNAYKYRDADSLKRFLESKIIELNQLMHEQRRKTVLVKTNAFIKKHNSNSTSKIYNLTKIEAREFLKLAQNFEMLSELFSFMLDVDGESDILFVSEFNSFIVIDVDGVVKLPQTIGDYENNIVDLDTTILDFFRGL